MADVMDREESFAAQTHTQTWGGAVDSLAGRLEPSEALRYLLAVLSGSAGIIHFAMVPSHLAEWTAEGVAFALAAWVQVVMAAVLVMVNRTSRPLMAAAIVANLVFVGAWAVTRTVGPPFGPHAGRAESISFVDLTTVGLEVALVVLAGVILARPRLRWMTGRTGLAMTAAGSAATVLLTTGVLLSPSARNHAHGGDGTESAAMDDHAHDDSVSAPTDDRGLSLLRNGHHHEIVEEELSPATQRALDDQLAVTREVAAQYPTVADATAAGFRRIGPYFPGIGAHYMNSSEEGLLNPSGVMDRDALLNPLAVIYDGPEPEARVAGFMYLSTSDTEPEGFAGPNDAWHYHEQLCLKYLPNGEIDVPFGLDNESTDQQCSAAGGSILPISPWMLHVWSAPGYDDDPDVTVFHEVHTDLTCVDGSYYMLPVEQWADHQRNICRAGAA